MALRYAVATGNWSSSATWNGGTLPTSSDDVYANGFTVTIDQNINVLSLRNRAGSPAVAGGGFVISSAVTIDVTGASSGIIGGTGSCITFNAGSGTTAIINTTRLEGPNANTSQTINHIGTGTLTIACALYVPSGNVGTQVTILFNSTGTLNYSGGILTGNFGTQCFQILGVGIVNIIANIQGGSNVAGINIGAAATINITGNIVGGTNTGRGLQIAASAVIDITGNVNSTFQGCAIEVLSGLPQINVTGSVFCAALSTSAAIQCANFNTYVKVIGPITASTGGIAAINATSSSAINIFSGPFISSVNAILPIFCSRVNYIITSNSYYEFRDSSTNGALPPATSAPATRLVSPDTAVDAPIPSNVRNGISYALGTFTGTLKVPNPNSVAFGIETDNTVGNAVLTPNAVWNHLTANITTANSIGERLKNAATVETTGDQLASLL